MPKTLVTILCSAGLLASVAIIVWGREQRVARPTVGIDRSAKERLVEGLRQACAVLAAGFVGGIISLGMGSRLLMRILAATSPGARGFLTDADETVGEVTASGSISLVLFVALAGIVGAGLYGLLRPVLPARSLTAGAVIGAILGGLLAGPSDLLNPDNRDFRLLQPVWLAVLLVLACIVVGSLTCAVLVDAWVARWPRASATPKGIAGLAPLIVGAIPPLFVMTVLIIAAQLGTGRPSAVGRRAARATSVLVIITAMAGTVWLGVNAGRILV